MWHDVGVPSALSRSEHDEKLLESTQALDGNGVCVCVCVCVGVCVHV